ncbi:MAG: putative bifunctional diguanylate cyclase/phosphodiesterase [Burkholderiales bacterium]
MGDKRILVIDDDATIQLLAAQSLRQAGYEVLIAANAEEGMELFDRERPDLLLLDVMMPGMDGFAACRILRQKPGAEHLPIIMLTNLDDTLSIHSAYDAGATDFVTKPINWTLLEYRLRYILRSTRTLVELAQSRANLAHIQRIARLGSWEWRAQDSVAQCSEEYSRIFGIALGSEPEVILDKVHPEDRPAVERALQTAANDGVPYELEYRVLQPDGEAPRTVHEEVEVIRDDGGQVVKIEGIIQDITERVQANEKIRQLAHYDSLTGLANRRLFRKIVEGALNRAQRRNGRCALMLLDIDHFKRINDTLGHEAGDQLLKTMAERIVNCVRGGDTVTDTPLRIDPVARLGGDEFTILLADLASPEDSAKVARRVLDAVACPLELERHEVTVTASIGIALYPLDATGFESLLKNADSAMYTAKDRGRNNFQFYSKAMNASALERMALESGLRKALRDQQFELHYQPKVDAVSGEMIGAEALLRWHHPERGMIAPAQFIPVAEETGLIVPIGEWVIEAACEQNGRWRRAGLKALPLAVNLAAPNFRHAGLVGLIKRVLGLAQLEPNLLELEVTESMLMRDIDATVSALDKLKGIGVMLAIDDFGTGYSSLNYLKRFSIDALKIDRSFVKDVTSNQNDAEIASAIIALARHLHLDVVAEGVETAEQADFLVQRGCDKMQGFLYSKPLPAKDFEALLAAQGPQWQGRGNRRPQLVSSLPA